MRPGIWRMNFSRQANRPTYGPPKDSGTPSDWPSATTMSAPYSDGGRNSAEADRVGGDDVERAGGVRALAPARGVRRHAAEEVRLRDGEAGVLVA